MSNRMGSDRSGRVDLLPALAFVLLVFSVPARAEQFDWAEKRAALGHQDKFRVLVDKVLSASNKWIMTETFMDEIRDADFNVIVPRVGCDDMKRVERVANMARDRGMFYMAWIRGTCGTRTGTKLVWASGSEQDLYSPNADELWTWMTGLILGHARLSAKNPAIVGTFLDFENYAKGGHGNCYALSYDEKILSEFAKAKGLTLPSLEPAQRHAWLEKNNHLAAFRTFQIESWRRRCRTLRQQIDAINPQFQLIVYPMGTLFLDEAIYPEWTTQRAPLVLADHCTYHRPGRAWHRQALLSNKRTLERRIQFARSKNVPMLYTSGIDPIYDDADPEFCGRNAAMICQVCAGYWIFYEGPKYKKDHPDYFKWFGRANRAVIEGRYDFWQQPRETPDPLMAAQRKLLETYCGAKVKPYTTAPMPAGAEKVAFTVRGREHQNVFCVLLKKGETLEGRLNVRRLGHYTAGCEFTVFGPDRGEMAKGRAELGKDATIRLPATRAGLHLIIVMTSSNPARLFVKNQHFCLLCVKPVDFASSQPSGYFLPVKEPREMVLSLSSPSPQETVLMTVFDPAGEEAARCDTVQGKTAQARVMVSSTQAGKPWSLQLQRASKGSLEDFALTLGDGCAKFLATHPTRLVARAD